MKDQLKYILLITLLISNQLFACSCAKRTMAEKYEGADYVAIIKVIGSVKSVFIEDDVPHQKVNFSIKEVLKGYYPHDYLFTHDPSPGFCGGEMKSSEEYVIFLNKKGYTSICSGTFILEQGNLWSESKFAEINALRSKRREQDKKLQVDR